MKIFFSNRVRNCYIASCVISGLRHFVGDCFQNRRHHLCAAIVFITIMALAAPVLTESVVVNQISGFQSPTRVALTNSGNIYVADHAQGVVVVLDSTGSRIETLKGLIAPLGLAIFEASLPECTKFKGKSGKCKQKESQPEAPQPLIYVGDEGDGSVRIFVDGVAVSALGSGRWEFGKPNGIAVTQEQTVYVVDSEVNQVKVYDSLGNLQFAFGSQGSGDGQLNFPTDVVVNEITGEVYVTDFMNQRIVIFDIEGRWIGNISPPLNDIGDPVFYRPAGLGIDPTGNLYVVDNALSCVAIIDRWGALVETIGYRDGQYWTGDLVLPIDAAADGERIYVTSNRQQLLKVFEVVP